MPAEADRTSSRSGCEDRAWTASAIRAIEADFNRSADTHLLRLDFPGATELSLYLKDESTHPTGSLKHRLARSLFLYGLCNGWIGPRTTIVEASSGSTAVSEAYFARMLDLPFIAVMPRSTSAEKIAAIEFFGGKCHFVDDGTLIYDESARLAAELGGHYMDQFTYAERATDWRGNNNIAQSMFDQLAQEAHPDPSWIVVGAGTGGTSATFGRYVRYRRIPSRMCLADPEASVFHRHVADRTVTQARGPPSIIEGIGRPRCEPSFLPSLIDRAVSVADAASIAGARLLSELTGRACGGSTGCSFWAASRLLFEMRQAGTSGSVAMLICDGGERYRSTLFDLQWLAARGLDPSQDEAQLRAIWSA